MTKRTKLALLAIVAIAVGSAWTMSFRNSPAIDTPEEVVTHGKSTAKKSGSPRHRGKTWESGEDFEIPDAELESWLMQAGKDPAGTLAKVIAIPETPKRRELLDWILSAWTTEDREPALEWLREQLPSMSQDPALESMEILLGSWAREEPLVTIGWAEGNIGPKLREEGFQSIAEEWASSDPEEMAEWIQSTSPASDVWAMELSSSFIEDDPARALEWCSRISDTKLAEESRQSVIQSWLLSSPEDAEAYLVDHPELVPAHRPEAPSPATRHGTD